MHHMGVSCYTTFDRSTVGDTPERGQSGCLVTKSGYMCNGFKEYREVILVLASIQLALEMEESPGYETIWIRSLPDIFA
jgi:hypothetical protein